MFKKKSNNNKNLLELDLSVSFFYFYLSRRKLEKENFSLQKSLKLGYYEKLLKNLFSGGAEDFKFPFCSAAVKLQNDIVEIFRSRYYSSLWSSEELIGDKI